MCRQPAVCFIANIYLTNCRVLLGNCISFNQADLAVGKKQARLVYAELKLLDYSLCPKDDFFTFSKASLYTTTVRRTGVVNNYSATWTARDSQVIQTGARTGWGGRCLLRSYQHCIRKKLETSNRLLLCSESWPECQLRYCDKRQRISPCGTLSRKHGKIRYFWCRWAYLKQLIFCDCRW